MSYDISLVNGITGTPCTMAKKLIRGGTVPAEYDKSTGRLVQVSQTDCNVNITYNYSQYFYNATQDDPDFAHEEPYEEEIVYGIRGLYGKTAKESIPMLKSMIARIDWANKDEEGNWITRIRTKQQYFYKDGTECKDPIRTILHGETGIITKEEQYTVSEGDTTDYWEATAANVIIQLKDMLAMAIENENNPDAIWTGD